MLTDVQFDLGRFDWSGVSGVSDVLMVLLNLILIVSIIFGYKSLKESVLSRDASLLTWAMQRMTEIKEDLDAVHHAGDYGNLTEIAEPDFKSPWPTDVESSAYRVSIELQRLAYLANSGLISKSHFENMWGPSFVKAWNNLELWVKHKRHKNGEPIELKDGAFTRNDFEKFAVHCKKA